MQSAYGMHMVCIAMFHSEHTIIHVPYLVALLYVIDSLYRQLIMPRTTEVMENAIHKDNSQNKII